MAQIMKTAVTAETNLNGKKERQSPIPKDASRIAEGAMKLTLGLRVALRNALNTSIEEELKKMETDFNEAKKLIGG